MLSTLTVGRVLALTSQRVANSKLASYSLNSGYRFANGNLGISKSINFQQSSRQFSKTNESFARFGRPAPERAVPVGVTAKHVGNMHSYGMLSISVAGMAGIGALCYYGLGMSNTESAVDRAFLWPQYVKDRIHSTYSHLGGGMAISVASAYAAMNSPTIMRFFSQGSLLFAFGSLAALIASSTMVQSIPYEPGMGVKQLAWMGHCSLLGLMMAPLTAFGGPAIIRAGLYTAGVVGGLSAIAVCAPSERFLSMTAPVSIGLGVVVASSIGGMFLPPTSRIGLGLYGISLYGGLLLFSGLLLYDTQKTIRKAESHPSYSMAPYDPINNSLHIYMDILNIFVRMLQIFGMGPQRRK